MSIFDGTYVPRPALASRATRLDDAAALAYWWDTYRDEPFATGTYSFMRYGHRLTARVCDIVLLEQIGPDGTVASHELVPIEEFEQVYMPAPTTEAVAPGAARYQYGIARASQPEKVHPHISLAQARCAARAKNRSAVTDWIVVRRGAPVQWEPVPADG
ncbi:hypothetical protein V6N00_13660 [Tersicoccus sp. MR15.9]|uniref:hypothetical protein n=1 Tax=Tersicoccus mangrovi TaxID=3121635 RepID=UPI002FE5CB99